MKQSVIFCLAIILFLQGSGSLLIMAAFYANRDYIAKNLCENRSRPELKCGGQCVLMKKLKKEQEKENKHPELKLKEFHYLLSDRIYLTTNNGITIKRAPYLTFQASIYHLQLNTSLFRPPIS